MADEHTAFWLALLDQARDTDQRARLWNGYLGWKLPPHMKGEGRPPSGWPQSIVDPPDGEWPDLTAEEHDILEALAKKHGGYPEFNDQGPHMDFSGHTFSDKADFSGLILIFSNFNKTLFKGGAEFSDKTRVYVAAWFHGARFEDNLHCYKARFDVPVLFDGAHFKGGVTFMGTEFRGGASFAAVMFESQVMFNDSKFEEKYFLSGGLIPLQLADFRNAKFLARTSFHNVLFGNDGNTYPAQRKADFSGAEFKATTDFRRAVFGGAPAFFNTTLHEDTDFGHIDWEKAETATLPVDYAIRAWERLELIMSKLEKPLDRHRFFRLKMRARRRVDGYFLRIVNRLFETIADYGWGVGRAFSWWFGHWFVASLILLVNTCSGTTTVERWKLSLAALVTGFSNAHAFLFLTANGGYLEKGRALVENNDAWGLLTAGVGAAEAVLGPIFLFLLLLTLRNRFRLA